MKTITEELLINLAGQAAYKRGLKLYEQGKVLSIEAFKNHQLATVQGSQAQVYAVDIIHTARLFQGNCNCPASDGIDFCKHCVAVALHLQHQQAPQEVSAKNSAIKSKKITAKEKQLQTIQQYLSSLTKPALEKHLLNFIVNDPDQRSYWLNQAENQLGLIDYKTLRKKMTAALPYNKDLFYYDQVRKYFRKLENLCEQIEANQQNLSHEENFKLAEYGLQRLSRALETIDDSGGYRLTSEDYLYDLLQDSFAKLDWDSDIKITWLFVNACSQNRLIQDIEPFYQNLTTAEKEQLNLLALQKWQALKSYKLFDYEQEFSTYALQELLVKYAESQQDWSTLMALYDKTADGHDDYLRQLEREINYQRYEQAETRLAKLKKTQSSESQYYQAKLYMLEAKLAEQLQQSSRQKQALWQAYQASHKLADLQKLLALEENEKSQQNWLKQAEEELTAKIKASQSKRYILPADDLVDLYLLQNKNQQAYEFIKKHPASEECFLNIAQHPNTTFINAWGLYDNLICQQIDLTNNQAYKKALKLIKKAATQVTNELEQQLFAKGVMEIRTEYQRKVNFTKWLDELIPTLFTH